MSQLEGSLAGTEITCDAQYEAEQDWKKWFAWPKQNNSGELMY